MNRRGLLLSVLVYFWGLFKKKQVQNQAVKSVMTLSEFEQRTNRCIKPICLSCCKSDDFRWQVDYFCECGGTITLVNAEGLSIAARESVNKSFNHLKNDPEHRRDERKRHPVKPLNWNCEGAF